MKVLGFSISHFSHRKMVAKVLGKYLIIHFENTLIK